MYAFGWMPDLPDFRDLTFTPPQNLMGLPEQVDHTQFLPEVYDQGQLGSCVGQGVSAALHHLELVQKKEPAEKPSPLFLYYQGRVAIGTVKWDSGSQIRDVVKAAGKVGYCEEAKWPYIIARFKDTPSRAAYEDASRCKITQYARVPQTQEAIKAALAAGQTVIFGFTVYDNIYAVTKKNHILSRPTAGQRRQGGHCVLIVGYEERGVIIRNSWGPRWGLNGNFIMTWDYLLDPNLSSDFWTIMQVPQVDV